ncbi:FAD-dependent oxidoreductase [Mycolicibacterium sp. BiH015]|uniref:GcvT family protein n=1 Tax=Mycolicibacterium sp. BiH015 TaxID=3018808 RepID=UPI0022E52F53|nr:FAD-dependent oxidoreductase [Mycolicibacterium sp. BiH015]MDA2893335.1 FAD-dependent oxidoreductase [Mycolicibacterium sp. BiH015]
MAEPGGLPSRASVVIIGGGVIGASIAYHLTKLGQNDVLLLEQGELSCGTTWHAAGIVGQVRPNRSMTALARYSIELYAGLESETGFATGWRQCGALWVARTEERVTHLRRAAASAGSFGTVAEFIAVQEAKDRFPLLRVDDLKAAVWLPEDGTVNPVDLTQALARGAKARGARIVEKTRVTGIHTIGCRVHSVTTQHGTIECETLVLAAGQWSKALGDTIGVTVPLYPAQHFYAVTENIDGVVADTPILRDPDGHVYFKAEVGGLVVGCFEPNALPWVRSADIPQKFEFQLLGEDWDHFGPWMESAAQRVPALEHTGIRMLYNGPESFTPDNNFLLGASPHVDNVYVAAGFNSGGIANAGGAGLALSEWILEGAPTRDLWSVDIARFGPYAASDHWLRQRTIETLGAHYALPVPNKEPVSGRGVRRSPIHHLHTDAGASFGTQLGWERVNWFAGEGNTTDVEYSFGRQNWHYNVACEHHAAREGVAVFDVTSLGKLLVHGPDAEALLQYLCVGDVSGAAGNVVPTVMLDDVGGIETEVVVVRLAADEYLVHTHTACQVRDLAYIRRSIHPDQNVRVVDVTSASAVFAVVGPRSAELLSRCSDLDFAQGRFPAASWQLAHLDDAQARVSPTSAVSAEGWQLQVPTEYAVAVYERILAEGVDLGVRPAGHYALDSLRIENLQPVWGRELSKAINIVEAGLDRLCKLDTDISFRGRTAVEKLVTVETDRKIIGFSVADDDVTLWGGEGVYLGEDRVGTVTSSAYGHTLKQTVGLAIVQRPGKRLVDWSHVSDMSVEFDGGRRRLYVRTGR